MGDPDSRAFHVSGKLTGVGRQYSSDELRKEQKHDRHGGDSPKHDLVHRHHIETPRPGVGRGSATVFLPGRRRPWSIGEIEGHRKKAECHHHHVRSVFFDRRDHARTGNAEHKQQRWQPATAGRHDC